MFQGKEELGRERGEGEEGIIIKKRKKTKKKNEKNKNETKIKSKKIEKRKK